MIAVGVVTSWLIIALMVVAVVCVWGITNIIADMVDRWRR